MSVEAEADLALVRKLHLELNGSGRRTRGTVQPLAKKIKREAGPTTSLDAKEASSFSQSGSDGRSGKTGRREGTLKRLIKKPDTESRHNNHREDDTTLVQTRKEVLEPQVSTKIASASKLNPTTEGDVGSRSAFNASELTSMAVNNEDEERAVALARSAAERESSGRPPRVKCFLEGLPYGVSIEPVACLTRESLEAALKETLLEDQSSLKSKSLEMFVYNCEGKKSWCRANEPDVSWTAALQGAKRIYITNVQAQ